MAAQKREEETQPPILDPKGKQRRVRRVRSRLFFLLPHGTEIKRLPGCERPAGDKSSVHNGDRPGVDRVINFTPSDANSNPCGRSSLGRGLLFRGRGLFRIPSPSE
jgi:hypothetical protein